MQEKKTIPIDSLQDLRTLAWSIASQTSNELIGLNGPIGVGKSTFTQHFLSYYDFEYKGSPTFTVMNEYHNAKKSILHLDLYTKSPGELLLEIMAMDQCIKIVEWIENAHGALQPDWLLTFSFEGEQRKVVVTK